jgi:hypothetical protein
MARRMGWTYEKLILTVLNHALSRYNMPKVSVDEKI